MKTFKRMAGAVRYATKVGQGMTRVSCGCDEIYLVAPFGTIFRDQITFMKPTGAGVAHVEAGPLVKQLQLCIDPETAIELYDALSELAKAYERRGNTQKQKKAWARVLRVQAKVAMWRKT